MFLNPKKKWFFLVSVLALLAFGQEKRNLPLAGVDYPMETDEVRLAVDVTGGDLIFAMTIRVNKVPTNGVTFRAAIPGDDGEDHPLLSRHVSPQTIAAKTNPISGQFEFREMVQISADQLDGFVRGLISSGKVNQADWNKGSVPCEGNGSCSITGTYWKGLYFKRAKATFDARTGCAYSLGLGSYAVARLDGDPSSYDASYEDDFVLADVPAACGSDPNGCYDDGDSYAEFDVNLENTNYLIICFVHIPQV